MGPGPSPTANLTGAARPVAVRAESRSLQHIHILNGISFMSLRWNQLALPCLAPYIYTFEYMFKMFKDTGVSNVL